MPIAAERLFVELTWSEAMLVIAAGVVIGSFVVAFLRALPDLFTRSSPAPQPQRQPPREIPPGWYAYDPGKERYWDGERWTDRYRDV